MIHDEKTTEIELPWAKKSDGPSATSHSTVAIPRSRALQASENAKDLALKRWVRELDMNSPWVLRLLALIAILLLSLLVV